MSNSYVAHSLTFLGKSDRLDGRLGGAADIYPPFTQKYHRRHPTSESSLTQFKEITTPDTLGHEENLTLLIHNLNAQRFTAFL
ncbi:MAG: hypothetical protein F6K47_19030 [Symploca sp. SIO2E6]|nr:hypothetical protein [Symploca sp. SIO2E6]